jgi:hypothetical protein
MWAYKAPFALWVRESSWAFAALEVVHLFGLTLLLGSILMLSSRFFGLTMRQHSIGQVARDVSVGMFAGLALIGFSGILMFSSGAVRYSVSGPFQFKMVALLVAIVVQSSLYLKVTRSEDHRLNLRRTRLMGGLALLLWISVGAAGRAIAFM